MQPDQQANVLARSASVVAIAVGEGDVETPPVNLPSQHTLRMVEIQQLIELGLTQIELTGFRSRFGLHACLKLQGFEPSGTDSLQSMTSIFAKPRRDSLINRLFH